MYPILVLNMGSSSLKAQVLDAHSGECFLKLLVEGLNTAQTTIRFSDSEPQTEPTLSQEELLRKILPQLAQRLGKKKLKGIGHRVVHGGENYDQPLLIRAEDIEKLRQLNPLAPLHHPANMLGIELALEVFGELPQVAVFDTAFHRSLPKRAYTYALPKALREKHGLKRYGFHGTSHAYVAERAADFLGAELENLRIISCHLGSGCSVAAVEYGRSVETSMGMTPLEGLVMATRAGDIDTGLLFHLAEKEGYTLQKLEDVLNKESGLKGLSNGSADMREIIAQSIAGDNDARLALQVFTHRLRKYIGAYAAVMGGVDAIVFTGGIGENSPIVRHRSCQRLDFLGAVLDEDANHDLQLSATADAQLFSSPNSRVKLLAVQSNEELAIARQAWHCIEGEQKVQSPKSIPIAVSARHVHLTQESVDILFGKGYQLSERAPLSQPGQFAANEQVALVGPKNTIERVRVLGPCRSLNQVEISRTDEFFLGIDAPVRASGQVENSPGIKLRGPAGEFTLKHGVICAWRHIHMTPEDAQAFGVGDKDVVEIEVQGTARPLTFGNVLVRVSPSYKLEMHIDTDEANAAELSTNAEGVLLATPGSAKLLKRKI